MQYIELHSERIPRSARGLQGASINQGLQK